jgi:hypothetical protein
MTSKIGFMVTRVEGWAAGGRPGHAPERVLVSSPGGGLVDHPVSALDRLLTRVRAHGLDRRLSLGEPPESSLLLALRAVHLVGPASRRDLARTVRHVIELTNRPQWAAHVPVNYRHVRAALRELEGLHDRLEAPGPVSARGIARLRMLFSDGAGPLYQGSGRDDLSEQLRGARAALDTLLP